MRTLRVDESTVLKLAVGPSLASVAVTTFQGLYLADFSSPNGQPGVYQSWGSTNSAPC